MARKPPFTMTSFLSHLFKPSKNPQPSGLTTKRLKGLRGGRRRSRLTAFNAMKPVNQRLLEESGQRESYLRGETTLAEARRKLRQTAVNLGIAKPVRPRATPPEFHAAPISRAEQIRSQIDRFLVQTLTTAGKKVNPNTVRKYSPYIPEWVIEDVPTWDAGQIADAASHGSIFDRAEGAAMVNPFWYR
jgi:hypothetical protein